MHRLTNAIQNYDWGSRSAIAMLLGAAQPSVRPEAELWMGAHPAAPSRVAGADGQGVSLGDLIARDPSAALGDAVSKRFGGRLPFLMKVLAADQPLSLQAHPSAEQAERGFAREEQARIPLAASHRLYKDPSHKPELLCAMTPFQALCGFRTPEVSADLLDRLELPALRREVAFLRSGPPEHALADVFHSLFHRDPPAARSLAAAAAAACSRLRDDADFSREYQLGVRLSALHPGDVGLLIALLLNFVELQPGEAIYLPSGELHAYLGGVGIEIMANSDNVLRGGLTSKHVDCAELTRVLHFRPLTPRPVTTRRLGEEALLYETEAAEFSLTRVAVRDGRGWRAEATGGPEILFCWRGHAGITRPGAPSIELGQGQSIFIPASTGDYGIAGDGELYRATVGSCSLLPLSIAPE